MTETQISVFQLWVILAGVRVGEPIRIVKYVNHNSSINPPQVRKIEICQKRP